MSERLQWVSILLDCASENLDEVNEKIYRKITTLAKDLVSTGEEIAKRIRCADCQ